VHRLEVSEHEMETRRSASGFGGGNWSREPLSSAPSGGGNAGFFSRLPDVQSESCGPRTNEPTSQTPGTLVNASKGCWTMDFQCNSPLSLAAHGSQKIGNGP
jgi:hypothetical protein